MMLDHIEPSDFGRQSFRLDSNDRFEIVARAFHKDTGHWPPGKDRPAAMGAYDQEAARLAWDEWRGTHAHAIIVLLNAVEQYLSECFGQ